MNEFRVRDEQVKFRCTEAERQAIEERFRVSGSHDLSAYLRKMAIDGYIINVDYKDLKDLIYEINKIGININQIAYHVNSEHLVHQKDMEHIQKDLDAIWQLLRSKLMHIENNVVKI
jgi:hypothetical protein